MSVKYIAHATLISYSDIYSFAVFSKQYFYNVVYIKLYFKTSLNINSFILLK